MTISVLPVFPSLLFIDDVPDYQDILPTVYKLRTEEGIQKSNMGGWHSTMQPLPTQLHPHIPFPKFQANCWYNINTNNQGNYSHQHPDNDWSGVLYLKLPPNPAKIEFEHPDLFSQFRSLNSIQQHHPKLQQHYNYYKSYPYTPVEGRMLLFQAALRHRVYLSTTDEERISLSFNIRIDDDE